ncbi:hypothetical protein DERP_010807 [Dermatophagoides pteronyssinus]|uniref:Uncharacterized protein n=1 Tax=Dermatophagoides pteronyssinus TaxID=6956 RepID=A0ABQ8J6N9_DERPT|nr:hypothetical protein DERP_010807 [Dermatophagoides pteronyssinus]
MALLIDKDVDNFLCFIQFSRKFETFEIKPNRGHLIIIDSRREENQSPIQTLSYSIDSKQQQQQNNVEYEP